MSITNATTLRKNLFEYLNAVAVNDEKIIVTTKHGNTAIVNEKYLRSLEETCHLASIPGMTESIIEGLNTPSENCRNFNWREELK